jgi:hypothetical protein
LLGDTYGTHLYACDHRWWKYHIADITRDFNGTCWTQDVQWEEAGKQIDPAQWGIKKLISLDKPGLSREQGTIFRGGNSGYQATNLAYLMGATRIILIGVDLMMNGQRHWFGEHPKGVGLVSNYHNFITYFRTIKPAEYGIEILNCSRETALEAFPRHHLEDVF